MWIFYTATIKIQFSGHNLELKCLFCYQSKIISKDQASHPLFFFSCNSKVWLVYHLLHNEVCDKQEEKGWDNTSLSNTGFTGEGVCGIILSSHRATEIHVDVLEDINEVLWDSMSVWSSITFLSGHCQRSFWNQWN